MKPINADKERIIVLTNQMLTRAGLSIEQTVARMQVDGCSLTRNTFENRFTTRVHQKPNIPEEWLLSLARVLRRNLAETEKCKAVEVLELCRLARFPVHRYSALEALFPSSEFTAAIEQIFPLSYFSVNQNAIGGDKSPRNYVSQSSAARLNGLDKSPKIWGYPPLEIPLYGFEEKIRILAEWVTNQECQLVSIWGMGGSGKSVLAAKVVTEVKTRFDYIFWFSLQNAPPFTHFIEQLVAFFAEDVPSPENTQSHLRRQTHSMTFDELRTLLLSYLQKTRTLIILDGFDTIIESGEVTGAYQMGFEPYGTWLQHFVESTDNNCLLLTSREKTLQFLNWNDAKGTVHAMTLGGLDVPSIQLLLKERALSGSEEEWRRLCEQYSGNPLMLKLAAEPIEVLFDGAIGRFLDHEASLFQEIRQLLEQQFGRLSLLEREILYWLLIEREATTIDTLQEDIGETVPRLQLLEALHALLRRSLVVQVGNRFTIPKIIQTYLAERLIELIVREVEAGVPLMLTSFALLKVQSKEHLRERQLQTVIRPILERLLRFSNHTEIVQKCLGMVTTLQQRPSIRGNYGAGNLLNLLGQLNVDLRGQDFSKLEICQADLRTMNLQDVNFSNATFRAARFWESFTSISALAYSSDGDYIAAGMTNGEIHLWSLKQEELRYRLVGHHDMIWDIVFSPDGKLLATACEDETVRLWELTSGECLHELTDHGDWVKSVCFLQNGTQLVTAGHDAIVRIWDVQSGECLAHWQAHTGWIWSVAVSPDDRLLATAGHDHMVKLWEIETGRCLYSLSGHTEPVRTVAFAPDGRQLLSASFDQTIRLWDVARGEQTQILCGHENLIWSAAYSPDGQSIASGGDDAHLFFWNIADGSYVRTTQGHQNRLWAVAFHPSGAVVASGGDDQRLRFWSVADGEPLRQLSGYSSQIWSLAVHPTLPLLASGGDDGTVRLWAHQKGVVEQLLQGYSERIRAIAFSPDGRLLATGGDDQSVRIWDVQRNVTLQTLTGHQNRVWSVAFTADQKRLVSCSEDQTIRLWKPESGQLVRTLYTEGGRIWSIACHPIQPLMASCGDQKEILLWDLGTGACIDAWEGHEDRVWSIAYDHSGSLLVSGSADQTVIIWDSGTGTIRHRLHGHQSAVWTATISPDGQWLASSGDDCYICIWHVPSGTLTHTLHGHTGCVWSLSFVNNRQLASGGEDESIRLWDVIEGTALNQLQSERPYERMRITGVKGLSEAQKASLCLLGAVEV